MSRIRGRGNESTEKKLVALFRKHGINGWRRHITRLRPGGGLRYIRPDFTFPRSRVIVFVDGCFWHSCPECSRPPKTNHAYWLPKLSANVQRDESATLVLTASGWKVFRIWEHALNQHASIDSVSISKTLARLKRTLISRSANSARSRMPVGQSRNR